MSKKKSFFDFVFNDDDLGEVCFILMSLSAISVAVLIILLLNEHFTIGISNILNKNLIVLISSIMFFIELISYFIVKKIKSISKEKDISLKKFSMIETFFIKFSLLGIVSILTNILYETIERIIKNKYIILGIIVFILFIILNNYWHNKIINKGD
jgi:hypothetical protein